jgi:alginate O-acetyltransferase complex protein AlgI
MLFGNCRMVFSSLLFLFFFLPIVLVAHFSVRGITARNLVLLAASLIFYAWGEPIYIWVMLLSIFCNYFFAIRIEDLAHIKRHILLLAVIFNLSLLALFKYSAFFLSNLNHLLTLGNLQQVAVWGLPLPLGVSFFTFHSLSYVVDVYRQQATAQRRPLNLALYICFFPQLIAGPIIRYHDICHQLSQRSTNLDLFGEGTRRFIGGLGKKVLIANVLAKPVDFIFALPNSQLNCELSWLAVFLYALQVYFDFAGYSEMAIGLGLMFGFRFLENFNYPYISQSMRELWNRWHISLANWFRDYLFRPLGGFRRNSKLHTSVLLLTVFFFCGLWHGASWNFVLWGLYNGSLLSIERFGLGKIIEGASRPWRHLYVVLCWLFGLTLFRSENLAKTITIISNMLGLTHNQSGYYSAAVIMNREVWLATIIGILASTPVFVILGRKIEKIVYNLHQDKGQALSLLSARIETLIGLSTAAPSLAFESCVLVLVTMQLASGAYNPFIYFRF